MQNSYTNTANQIFKDGKVIIEDDINPTSLYNKNVKDIAVDRYLNDLDLFYSKNSTPTIDFFEPIASEVKQRDYIYLEVYFKSMFNGKHSVSTRKYKSTERVATIIAERSGTTWQMRIASVVFYKPEVHTFVNEQTQTVVLPNTDTTTIAKEQVIPESIPPTESTADKATFTSYWELGAFLGYASNTGIAPGIKVRYNLTPQLGVQAGFNYFIKGETMIASASGEVPVNQTAFEIELNGTYTLPITAFDFYLLAGLNYMSFKATASLGEDKVLSNNQLGINLGIGAAFPINDTLTPFFEAKYFVDNQVLAGVGVRFTLR
jgi:opacity protein-like surface antigen